MGNDPTDAQVSVQASDPTPGERPVAGSAAARGLRRGFESLGVRNYRLYWSGQVVSLVGTWMQQVSLPWLVLALGGTPIQLGHRRRAPVRPVDAARAVRRRPSPIASTSVGPSCSRRSLRPARPSCSSA